MDELVRGIKKTKSKNANDFVEFQHKGFWRQQNWKGQLGKDAAAFVDQSGQDVLVARKDDVKIKPEGKVLLGKTLKASIRIGDRRMHALIKPEYYQRYQAWKETAASAEARPAA